MRKLSDEIDDGKLFFYHSAKGLDAYKYLIEGNWRTSSGHYGHALYGNMSPLWKDNFNGPATDQNKLYGPYRFKVQSLRSRSLLFCNVQDGAKILAGYDADYAQVLLEDHGVPDDMIKSIMSLIRKEPGVYASATSLKPRNNSDPGTLLAYGFNGFVYDGNLDGKTVVFYNPQPSNVRFVGVSFDDGKTFMDIPKGTTYSQFLQLVDNFKNPKKAVAVAKSSLTVGASTVQSSLLSPSVLKFMNRPALKAHVQKVLDLESDFLNSKLGLQDIIFIESWYIRFNLTHRKKIYSWVSDYSYVTVILAAYTVAYACTDNVVPVKVTEISKVLDVRRLLKYLLPFSIKNKYGFSDWNKAFYAISFPSEGKVVCTWGVTTPVAVLARFLVGHEWASKNYSFDILDRYFNLLSHELVSFSKSRSLNYTFDDILNLLNATLPDSFPVFMTDHDGDLNPIEVVDPLGIIYK